MDVMMPYFNINSLRQILIQLRLINPMITNIPVSEDMIIADQKILNVLYVSLR